ncbi:hypothetical protein ACFP67_01990 [Mammaliicoccus sciuri]|uniref:hypothetical protein n=1 Tax=Mammaliicoccus sciuri TaxID=1296 RepID=UPI0015E1A1C5|nr:hypothetical protein [Mammaliicoccus sciuri]
MGHEKSSDINGDYWLYILLIGLIANQQIGITFLIIGLAMILFGVIKEPSSKT